MKIYKRWQEKPLQEAAKTRRVLLLSGPRQCGKTTLCQEIASEGTLYMTLDNPALFAAAKNDPVSFIKNDGKMMIIDEVQHAPELLLAIKEAVDKNIRPGQYLLTGSSNIQALPNVRESLAGRIRRIRLRGLTQGEIEGVQPSFLEMAFTGSFKVRKVPCSQEDIIARALKGGFPEAMKESPRNRRLWHLDYVNALLERDLKDIANIRRQESMRSLVSVLASWSGKYMDTSAIGSFLSIQRATLESYLNALEALYLVEKVPPWLKTDYDRIGKRSKIYMSDCGLMSSILGWKVKELRFDPDRLGKLFETFVFNELSAQIDVDPGMYEVFQYRDKDKREVDFIIEREDGALLGIEVKSGSVVDPQSFKHLKWFQKTLSQHKSFTGIVLYTGEYVLSFGSNLWAIPISLLWHS